MGYGDRLPQSWRQVDLMRNPMRQERLGIGAVIRMLLVALVGSGVAVGGVNGGAMDETSSGVHVWRDEMVIPTYEVGPPEPNPIFYTNESYQGAQKHVYPYPLQDRLSHVRKDRVYTALHLENEYIKLTVLPEIGGRLFSAADRTNGYDFFYRQHVIKPALIGMLGAWISGGVEWCAFHHHRDTTFMPVDHRIIGNDDGSATIWIGEIERRHRMKWLIGLTLYPGKSYIETTVRLFNRTAQPQTMLYWANVAVHVDDTYQVIFPPSVRAATHHAKIDFVHWPIAQGTYLGRDYTGRDISRFANLPVPVSFFAWDLREDFMGGYDHGREAGVVHIGDHHVMPGAKLWAWGTGPAGQLWERILTDTDGPYAELMVGGYSDNQPDYSWIKPYETRSFRHYWYPVRGIGGFRNANLDAAVNLEVDEDGMAKLGLHATSSHRGARAVLESKGEILHAEATDIGPDRPYVARVAVPLGTLKTDLRAVLISADGRELISYQPILREPLAELPAPVEAPPLPGDIATIEELYLTGLQVEQINNPSTDPVDYYGEALRRDPGDSRCNTRMGLHYNRRWKYAEAEAHLRRAIERISKDYTRPGDTEAYYQLGLALRGQNRFDEASDTFERASWDMAVRAAAQYQLAELACLRGAYEDAVVHIDQSLAVNAENTKAKCVKSMMMRKLDRSAEASALADEVLAEDPLDVLAGNELFLALMLLSDPDAGRWRDDLDDRMRGDVQSYLELAADYMNCGLWEDAVDVLMRVVDRDHPASRSPLVHYYLGHVWMQIGENEKAGRSFAEGARVPGDYCFPFRRETLDVLKTAIEANPADARAYYYLGNLLYERRPEEAIRHWERSRALDDTYARVHRNLGWAYDQRRDDVEAAVKSYEAAVQLDASDPRFFLELDRLYEVANVGPSRRMAMMDAHHDVIARHQDSFLREIMVLVLVGRYDEAIEHLTTHHFHAREGSEGIFEVYVDAYLLRGLERMRAGAVADALSDFRKAAESPENLATPRNHWRDPQIAYFSGQACEALGNSDQARTFYEQGVSRPGTTALSATRYAHGLCKQKMGDQAGAEKVFEALIENGRNKLTQGEIVDYFAKFGAQSSEQARRASGHLAIGLGLLGQGDQDAARRELEQAVELNRSDVWAQYYAAMLERE